MSHRVRTIAVFALLLLGFAHFTVAALQPDPCDEGCGAACGDCASCPQLASLTMLPVMAPRLSHVDSLAMTSLGSATSPARAIEHVPLATRA
jgi:hypothetical protein